MCICRQVTIDLRTSAPNANAICSSINLLLFIDQPPEHTPN